MYRTYDYWQLPVLVLPVIAGIVAIAMPLVTAALGAWLFFPFAMIFLALAALVVPRWLLQVAYELRLEDGVTLAWKTAFRSGSLVVSSIRDVRPYYWATEVIEFDDGHRVIVRIREGFRAFINDLGRATPSLPIDVSPSWLKFSERWPFWGSGYEHWS